LASSASLGVLRRERSGMFSNLNMWEVGVLLLLALFIFGPERLPKVISDAMRVLRNVRDMARNATNDLSRELGTEVRLEDLHPRTFIRKHLLSEDEEAQLRRPFDDMLRDVRQVAADASQHPPQPDPPQLPRMPEGRNDRPFGADVPLGTPYQPESPGSTPRRYDDDAT
jgi:sec-independent protein translocase protein TatB